MVASSLEPPTPRMPKKSAKPPKPTPAELDLLRVIWRLGPSTVKDLHAAACTSVPTSPTPPCCG